MESWTLALSATLCKFTRLWLEDGPELEFSKENSLTPIVFRCAVAICTLSFSNVWRWPCLLSNREKWWTPIVFRCMWTLPYFGWGGSFVPDRYLCWWNSIQTLHSSNPGWHKMIPDRERCLQKSIQTLHSSYPGWHKMTPDRCICLRQSIQTLQFQ